MWPFELLFSNEWLSGEKGWEKSIQAICFKDISVNSWDLWLHLFNVLSKKWVGFWVSPTTNSPAWQQPRGRSWELTAVLSTERFQGGGEGDRLCAGWGPAPAQGALAPVVSGRLLCAGGQGEVAERVSLVSPLFLPGGELLLSCEHPPGSLLCALG